MADSATNARGIDVSHYQGVVDWGQVHQAGVSFGFAKATEGLSTVDSEFATNWQAMSAAGVLRGAYHFFHPEEDAAAQATHFLSVVGEIGPNDLPPVLDVETTNGVAGSAVWAGAKTWLTAVAEATGRTPILYTSHSFWNGSAPDSSLTKYPLWLADYATTPTLPHGFATWHFWQYSQSGSVAGVAGAVDLDVWNGTLATLLAFVAGD
jgi:lysozyme